MVPSLLASKGLMSKMSTPSIFPRISNLSRPVACSKSVGTVPGWPPGGSRSASVLISAKDFNLLSVDDVGAGVAAYFLAIETAKPRLTAGTAVEATIRLAAGRTRWRVNIVVCCGG